MSPIPPTSFSTSTATSRPPGREHVAVLSADAVPRGGYAQGSKQPQGLGPPSFGDMETRDLPILTTTCPGLPPQSSRHTRLM